jgi:hypothetical protein
MRFTIKAGRHYANNLLRMRVMWGNKLEFRFRLSPSVLYNSTAVVNGWSKILGIAEPFGHTNSCRAVFIVRNHRMFVGMYCYVKGVSPQEDQTLKEELGEIVPGYYYKIRIEREKKIFHMTLYDALTITQSVSWSMPAARWWLPIRFILHPYIGGRFTLDNDCYIDIERIK